LQKVNRQLYPDIKEDMFISMAYLILDRANGDAILSRAGHDAPIFFDAATGTTAPVKPPGMVLGIDSGSVFDRITGDFALSFKRDDCLLLYTDGVTEALDANGDEFGPDRMIECMRTSAREGAPAVITKLIDELRNFVGAQPQNDDITLIAIRKT
jgi:sigma-B regulation protein RsbU (phosphoserine phosphatase)